MSQMLCYLILFIRVYSLIQLYPEYEMLYLMIGMFDVYKIVFRGTAHIAPTAYQHQVYSCLYFGNQLKYSLTKAI